MKVAIIGATGQLGTDLVKAFSDHEVIPLKHSDIEVTSRESCEVLREHAPDVVINTAAYHKTDECEVYPEKAFLVNAAGAKNVAEVCSEIGATPIYISTDYVFDGTKSESYTEKDTPNPINTYGISKLAGEFYTKLAEKYYIIRVASLFGVAGASGKGGNFVETMIKKAKNGEEIKVVDDMVMSPTYTRDAAEMIKNIVEKKLPYGIYHVTNSGYCSWYEFARAIFDFTKLNAELSPIKTASLNLRARRPLFSALTSVKLGEYSLEMRDWKPALQDYLREKGHL